MKFNKAILASLFTLSLAFGVQATEKPHQMITIKASSGEPIEVTVNKDGNEQVFAISAEALTDKDLLASELSGSSAETIEHVSQALSGLHQAKGHQIFVAVGDENNNTDSKQEFHRVVEKVIDLDDEGVKKFACIGSTPMDMDIEINELHMDANSSMPFDVIKHLMSKSELTSEQLNELQQLIDSKR
jgi:hypothetical protein